jgi:hypothetical protein
MSPRGMAVFPTPDIFPAAKQGLMLAKEDMEIAPIGIKLMPGICWWDLFHK